MSSRNQSVAGAIAWPVVVFGLSCIVFTMTTWLIALPPAWATFEFCQYAEIARNLAQDGTFDTRLVEPMALAYLDANQFGSLSLSESQRWPVVNRYPLPCFVIAALFRGFGQSNEVAAWSNGLAIGGLAALATLLARHWYGPGWGAIAALLILANPAFYGYFILLGTPDIWFALIFALELLAFVRLWAEPDREKILAPIVGLLAGLAFLTRFNVTLFLLPQVAILLTRRRLRAASLLVAFSAIVAAPMLLYNLRHFGRPGVSVYSTWNLLDDMGAYRVEPWLYYKVPETGPEIWSHLAGFIGKFVRNLTRVVPVRIWSLWHFDVVLPLGLLALMIRLSKWGRRQEESGGVERAFLLWSAALFALQLVVFSAMRLELEDRGSPHHGRYFFWFAVPVLLLTLGGLKRLTLRHRAFHGLTALVILVQLVLFGLTWKGWIEQNRGGTNVGRDPIRKMLSQLVPDDRVIVSNQPQWTAWYCKKRSVSLPADPDELARMNRTSPTPAAYLLIDLNANFINLDPRWATLVVPAEDGPSEWETSVLIDFEYVLPVAQTRPIHYVLLRRRDVPPSRLEQTWREGRN